MKKLLLAALLLCCPAFAQRPALTSPVIRFSDNNGKPLAFGTLQSYAAGTTTPLSTFVDSTTGAVNPNPVPLDATGSATVFLGANVYKFVLKNSAGVVQWTADNIAEGMFQTSYVQSVFGRTGVVTAHTGDYTCAQVTDCPTLPTPPTLYNQTIKVAGSAATQEPVLNFITGVIGSIFSNTITAGGSGYTGAPTVTYTGGGCASEPTGSANLTSGAVSSVAITFSGTGCVTAPAVGFSGGGGTGAAATSTLTPTGITCVDNPTSTSTDCTFAFGTGSGGAGTFAINDVTGSRSFGATYQNTTTGLMFISGWGTTGGSSTGNLRVAQGPSTASLQVYGNQSTATVSGGDAGFNGAILPGYFYSVVASGTVSGPGKWVEITGSTGGGGGGFTAGGDLSGTSTSQNVIGLKNVPFCTGFTPTNGQAIEYTTASSPNPCYTAATPSGSGSSVTVNGGGALGTANFNGTTPAAASGFQNSTFQSSGANVSVENPLASGSVFGLAKVDGTTITASGGVISAVASGVRTINGTPGAFTFTGNVSCTGTACSFGGTTSTTYELISELGCAAQNSNLNTGGGTSDTACINTALAAATATHPVVLIQDGVSLIDGNGISGPATGNWGIIGLGGGLISSGGGLFGTGFYFANGSTGDVISNGVVPTSGNCDTPPGAVPSRNANVLFENFAINGNQANNSQFCFGIDIVNMNGISISNVTVFQAPRYQSKFTNVGNLNITGSTFVGGAVNGDGIHVEGPSNDINLSDNYFQTGDDAIAMNAWEGYCGLIQRVGISNSTAHGVVELLRAYSRSNTCANGNFSGVDKMNIVNYSGDATQLAAIFGLVNAGAPTENNSLTNIKWTNSTISSPFGFLLADTIGTIAFDNVQWTDGTCTDGVITSSNCGFVAGGQINASVNTLPVSALTLNNVTTVRTPAGHAGSFAIDTNDALPQDGGTTPIVAGVVNITGYSLQNVGGSYSAAPTLLSFHSAVDVYTACNFSDIDATNITAISAVAAGSFSTPCTTLSAGATGTPNIQGAAKGIFESAINDAQLNLYNINNAGVAGYEFSDPSNVAAGLIGYANPGSSFTAAAGQMALGTFDGKNLCLFTVYNGACDILINGSTHNISSPRTFQAVTLTDGTCSISGGALSGCAGGGSATVIQVNGTPTSTATPVNLQTSTANAVGLTITPSNPSAGNVKSEITGTVNIASGGTGAGTAAADTVFGNPTGSTAAPSYTSSPVVASLDALNTYRGTAATVASASTIAPTTPTIFLTGTTTVHNITPQTGCTASGTDCTLTVIIDPNTGPAQFANDGNINTTAAPSIGSQITFVYNPATSFWYPPPPAGACATCVTSATALTDNAVVIGQGGQASATISADTTTTHFLAATAGAPAFRALASGDIPNNAANTSGNAATASAVALSGITGLGTNVATFLGTPSSANLLAALTTKTGSGNAVFSISPALTGTPDASGATQFKMPVAASFATLANGEQGYDTTALNWHIWANGVDNLNAIVPASVTITNNDCAQWSNVGGTITLKDTSCGGLTNPMTTLGDMIDATTSGVAQRLAGTTAGAGTYILAASPTSATPVNPVWLNLASTGKAIGGTTGTFSNNIIGTGSQNTLTNTTFSGSELSIFSIGNIAAATAGTATNIDYVMLNSGSALKNSGQIAVVPSVFTASSEQAAIILRSITAGTLAQVASISSAGAVFPEVVNATTYATATNCASSASPAVCGSAAAGAFTIAAAATSIVVNTTAITANSEIEIQPDASLGTRLSVTCNTTLASIIGPVVTARTPGTSFTVSITGTLVTNPACYTFTLTN